MGARVAQKRAKTARELAEQFGIGERHVRRLAAQPRADFEGEAAERRAEAVRLRLEGHKVAEIMLLMGLNSKGAVGALLASARRRGELPVERWTHATKIAQA